MTENREVASAKSLVLKDKSSTKSLIYIKNNKGPRMENLENSCLNISPGRILPSHIVNLSFMGGERFL